MTIKQSLLWGFRHLEQEKINSAAIDAELLLLEALNEKEHRKDRLRLCAHPEYALTKAESAKYKKLISRRAKHEPLAYIIKHKEFYGLDFYVNKNVLIPRPETETLIEALIQNIKEEKIDPEKAIFIDIGTGSGCIPIVASGLFKFSDIYAADISQKALLAARLNAGKHNEIKKIRFIEGDLFMPLSLEPKIKNASHLIITANLPYIKSADIKTLPRGVKKYEPHMALDGGKSGIVLIERLLAEIYSFRKRHTNKQSMHIFLEIGFGQKSLIAKKVKEYFKNAKAAFLKDLSGKYRIAKVAII